jgi:DNA-directed RNA polymerase specialized sigma24 family protein
MAGRRNGPPRTERTTEDRPPRPRQPRRDLDEEVVALREQGQSYSAVARTLGIKRAVDAQAAFIRAMRKLPDEQRKALYKRELGRLDQLEARIRSRDAGQPAKLERHLVALGALRDAML